MQQYLKLLKDILETGTRKSSGRPIASYALLTHLICRMMNMIPGTLTHSLGDVHIYENHLDAAEEQLQRDPEKLPTLTFSSGFDEHIDFYQKMGDLNSFIGLLEPNTFKVEGYSGKPLENETKLSTGLK